MPESLAGGLSPWPRCTHTAAGEIPANDRSHSVDYVCSTLQCASSGGAGEPKGQRAELNGLRADGSSRAVTWERQQRRVRRSCAHRVRGCYRSRSRPYDAAISQRQARRAFQMGSTKRRWWCTRTRRRSVEQVPCHARGTTSGIWLAAAGGVTQLVAQEADHPLAPASLLSLTSSIRSRAPAGACSFLFSRRRSPAIVSARACFSLR